MSKKINRIGEENINKQGYKMKIISYKNANDIDIYFVDFKYTKYKCKYFHFKKGNVCINNLFRIGEEKLNKYGSKMEIVRYINNDNIDVYFEEYNYTKKNIQYNQFKIGNIKSPYCKSIYGKGYIGEGKYNSKDNKYCYNRWTGMMEGGYSVFQNNKHPTYKDVTVCEEWHNFQNFAKWYEENYYEIDGERIELDKDILVKNNKTYSPETCIFVPQKINVMFVCKRKRDSLHYGVIRSGEKYISGINKNDKRIYLGTFNTSEEAFNVYKQAKEKYIKQVADEYKDKIPESLYDALYRYEVEK